MTLDTEHEYRVIPYSSSQLSSGHRLGTNEMGRWRGGCCSGPVGGDGSQDPGRTGEDAIRDACNTQAADLQGRH